MKKLLAITLSFLSIGTFLAQNAVALSDDKEERVTTRLKSSGVIKESITTLTTAFSEMETEMTRALEERERATAQVQVLESRLQSQTQELERFKANTTAQEQTLQSQLAELRQELERLRPFEAEVLRLKLFEQKFNAIHTLVTDVSAVPAPSKTSLSASAVVLPTVERETLTFTPALSVSAGVLPTTVLDDFSFPLEEKQLDLTSHSAAKPPTVDLLGLEDSPSAALATGAPLLEIWQGNFHDHLASFPGLESVALYAILTGRADCNWPTIGLFAAAVQEDLFSNLRTIVYRQQQMNNDVSIAFLGMIFHKLDKLPKLETITLSCQSQYVNFAQARQSMAFSKLAERNIKVSVTSYVVPLTPMQTQDYGKEISTGRFAESSERGLILGSLPSLLNTYRVK